MMIDKTKKIEKIAEKEGSNRPQLENAWYDSERELLIATNGKGLVAVKVKKDEGDISGYVSPQALKASRTGGKYGDSYISCNGTLRTNGIEFPRPQTDTVGQYPNWDMVIPKNDRLEARIGINVKLLANMADALGKENITFGIALKNDGSIDNTLPIRIYSGDDIAVMMPERIK